LKVIAKPVTLAKQLCFVLSSDHHDNPDRNIFFEKMAFEKIELTRCPGESGAVHHRIAAI
jgi:hypothetical protein